MAAMTDFNHTSIKKGRANVTVCPAFFSRCHRSSTAAWVETTGGVFVFAVKIAQNQCKIVLFCAISCVKSDTI
jgi:hypothetical protein